MPKKQYDWDTKIGSKRLFVIERANAILEEYYDRGFVLTLRQLYYQFVARAFVENKQQNYKALGETMSVGRLAGLVDWDHMEDRTRMLRGRNTYANPASAMRQWVEGYAIDMWKNQDYRPEIWVEKDALVDVVNQAATPERINYFSCRGYTSQSEMRAAGERLAYYKSQGQTPVIIHLGDHDPSGIDMSRDIETRVDMFMGGGLIFERIALNMDQIEMYSPPPNPAKVTDSRYAAYQSEYGDESWELDALDPTTMTDLIVGKIREYRDEHAWAERKAQEETDIKKLRTAIK